MASRYLPNFVTVSCIYYLVISYFIRSGFGIVTFPDSSFENYNDIRGISSEKNRQLDLDTDIFNDLVEKEKDQGGEEDASSRGWNYLDGKKKWTPHEKTISLQFLDDDGHFTHSPPAWPHNEYLLSFPYPSNFNAYPHIKNSSGQTESESLNQPSESDKDYEWTRLRPGNRPPKSNLLIGPGFYDDPNNNNYLSAANTQSHQSITDGTTSSVATASAGGGLIGGTGLANSGSEYPNHGKFYNSLAYDQYRRKRLRLKIHPGLLAAPIAGLAAYKAVSAFVSKPLLFELGWVNNKADIGIGGGGGGWGWNGGGGGHGVQPYPPPYYPPVVPVNPYPHPPYVHVPVINYPRPAGPLVPQYPILRPNRHEEPQKSAWWNPFAALTPRFRGKKERKNCCNS